MHLKTLGIPEHNADKPWVVEFHDEFLPEFREFPRQVKKEIAARIELLLERGPLLGRPWADTLKGARHANMKELRFDADGGVWRVAFAFDPERKAILLVGGDKARVAKGRFYGNLIEIADRRLAQHLSRLVAIGKKEKK
jgi:hypothetical protein